MAFTQLPRAGRPQDREDTEAPLAGLVADDYVLRGKRAAAAGGGLPKKKPGTLTMRSSLPWMLAYPFVYIEVSLKVEGLPLTRPGDPGEDGEELSPATRELQRVLSPESTCCYHLESDLPARGTAAGSRYPPELQARVSEQFRSWNTGFSSLVAGVLGSTCVYFLVVPRGGCVWMFSASGAAVYGSEAASLLKDAAEASRIPCTSSSASARAPGHRGLLAAAAALSASFSDPLVLGASLPLLLSPSPFPGATCSVPHLKITPHGAYRLTGRLLPDSVYRIFAVARLFSTAAEGAAAVELDISPNVVTSVCCFSRPHPVPWCEGGGKEGEHFPEPSNPPLCPKLFVFREGGETVQVTGIPMRRG